MTLLKNSRPGLLTGFRSIIVGLGFAILFCQCKSNQTYKDIEYSSEKLATPHGHGMKKKDYPFDDNGKYRTDWVKSKPSSRTKTSYPAPVVPEAASTEASTSIAAAAGDSTADPAAAAAYSGPADGAVAAPGGIHPYTVPEGYSVAASPETAPSSSTTASSSPSTRYHKVASGDTLYGISHKYSVDLDTLKRTNGISGSNIFKGQSLRIP